MRSRKGYFAPKGDLGHAPPTPAALSMQNALDSPYYVNEVPLRMTVLVGREAPGAKVEVGIVTDVDVNGFDFREEADRLEDSVELHLLVTKTKTQEAISTGEETRLSLRPASQARLARGGLSLAQQFELAPGAYWVQALLRESNGGRKGTLTHQFEVPEPVGLRFATPVLSDALDAETGQAVLIARRTFTAEGRLHCQYEVLGGAVDASTGQPRVSGAWDLRTADDSGHWKGDPTPIQVQADGRVVRRIDLPIAEFEPGDYTLTVDVHDEVTGQALTIAQPFALAAP